MGKYRWTLLVLITILLISCYTSGTAINGQPQTPPYAFNGAYARYSVNGTSFTGVLSFNITNVDATAKTFNVSIGYTGPKSSFHGPKSSVSASFSNPRPFPVINQSSLQMLNRGQSAPGGTVKTDVSVSVPAGTFSTDEVTTSNSTMWIEVNSGLVIKETGSLQGFNSTTTMALQSTNIPMVAPTTTSGTSVLTTSGTSTYTATSGTTTYTTTSGTSTYIVTSKVGAYTYTSTSTFTTTLTSAPLTIYLTLTVIAVIVIAIAVVVIFLMVRRRKLRRRISIPPPPTVPEYPSPPPKPAAQVCSTCGNPLTFVQQVNRWYCAYCRKYQ
jgi:hypothetical protein